jgi:NADH-quinone oxidoreductase subunit F
MQIVSKNFDKDKNYLITNAIKNGAYQNLKEILQKDRLSLIEEIDKSGLRGKGGGGGPTGKKWNMVKDSSKVYLCVNADESEPGTCKDRQILELDPHLLIEGIIISSFALNSTNSYIYIRGEYTTQAKRLQNAIDEAYSMGYLGKNILDSGIDVDITLHRGAGAYICGEKSALLESIEGKRGHPRLKPKRPEPDYLFGKDAVVNNVETISTVPFIIKNGASAYRSVGTKDSPGTLLFAISGHINRPQVKEVPFGYSMTKYIQEIGGGVWKDRKLKAIIPGGSSTKVLKADEIENLTLDYESMRKAGTSLGTGGMIVMDENTCMVKALKNLLDFYHEESCGQCTPCREGSGWAYKLVSKIYEGRGTMEDLDTLSDVSFIMNGKTICVFGPAVSDVIDGFVTKFRDEFEAYIRGDR